MGIGADVFVQSMQHTIPKRSIWCELVGGAKLPWGCAALHPRLHASTATRSVNCMIGLPWAHGHARIRSAGSWQLLRNVSEVAASAARGGLLSSMKPTMQDGHRQDRILTQSSLRQRHPRGSWRATRVRAERVAAEFQLAGIVQPRRRARPKAERSQRPRG